MSTNFRPSGPTNGAGWSLYAGDGHRKYLNQIELSRFLKAAAREPHAVHTLCLVLAYTGCRISEALSLTISSVQPEMNVIAIRGLKQRGRLSVREIPVPQRVIELLLIGHESEGPDTPLWPHGRTLAWQHVKRVMAKAEIIGPHAIPHGLRHGFGVSAVQSGMPLSLIQKWLGHANIATTAIYTDVAGPEERRLAEQMWRGNAEEHIAQPHRLCYNVPHMKHNAVEMSPMGNTTTLTIRVDQAMKDRLERAAKQQRRSKAFVAVEAIEEYLSVQEWQEQRIRQAIGSADNGEGIPHGRVREWVESWDAETEKNRPKA